MKEKATMALVALAVLALMTGCSTTRQDRSKVAAASMGDLSQLLSKGERQAAAMEGAAGQLAAATPAKLRDAYGVFAKDARVFRATAETARDQARAMQKRSRRYFSTWEKELEQIANADLKKMSRERQALLESEFNAITADMAVLGKAYAACETSLADVEKFLGNDLTGVGADLARPHVKRLAQETAEVRSATQRALGAITHLEKTLKPR